MSELIIIQDRGQKGTGMEDATENEIEENLRRIEALFKEVAYEYPGSKTYLDNLDDDYEVLDELCTYWLEVAERTFKRKGNYVEFVSPGSSGFTFHDLSELLAEYADYVGISGAEVIAHFYQRLELNCFDLEEKDKQKIRFADHVEWFKRSAIFLRRLRAVAIRKATARGQDHPGDEWLIVTESAKRFIQKTNSIRINPMTLGTAKKRISEACSKGKIVNRGKGSERRIDPDSLSTYILLERDKILEKAEAEYE